MKPQYLYLTKRKETADKVLSKDYDYFLNQVSKNGFANVLEQLNQVSKQYSVENKAGREYLSANKAVVERLQFNERSVEE